MNLFWNRLTTVALAVVLVASLALVSGCSSAQPSTPPDDTTEQATPPAEETPAQPEEGTLYTPEYKPNGKEVAVIKTNKGTIKVELLGEDAPIHVGNFVELARKGFYDNTKFHRFEPGFVVQGGDPQTKDATSEQVAAAVGDPTSRYGTGGPGYMIKGEFQGNPNKHVLGTLAMARAQSPDSAGSQFYFTLGPQSFLDGNYTVFGQTVEGTDVIQKLGAGDVVESITIENASE